MLLREVRSTWITLALVAGCFALWQCGSTGSDTLPVTTASSEAKVAFDSGLHYFENVRYHDAQRYFEKAIKLDPQFSMAYLYLALSNPTAKGLFENINQASKYSLKASEGERLLIEAQLAGVNGDPNRQTELLVKLAALYPRDARTLMFLAWQYFGQQEYDSAITLCEKIVQIEPDCAPAYNILGYSYRFLDKSDEAGKAFREYIRLTPNDPNPYDSYAELLMHQGKFEDAIEQYRLALKQDRTFAASRVGIASNLVYLGRYDEARREMLALSDSAVNPGQKRLAILVTAISYVDEGNLESGLQKLNELFEYDRSLGDAASSAGDLTLMLPLLVRMGKFDESDARLAQFLEIVNSSDLFARIKKNANYQAYAWRAVTRAWQGHFAEAREQIETFLREVDPDRDANLIRGAYLIMGMISVGEKDYTRAIAELDQGDPNEPLTAYYLARAYEGKGELDTARRLYKELAESYQLNSVNYALVRKEAARKAVELSDAPSS